MHSRIIIVLGTLALSAVAAEGQRAPAAEPVDARVEALLRQMTLEEKVGEMTQVTLGAVVRQGGTATRPTLLDSAKLEDVVVNKQVGSLLNTADVALTPREWTDVTRTIQRFAARKRLKIPVLYGIDAVHGHHYMLGATVFPHNLGLAATWNPMLARRANQITSYETRASGIAWNFSPVLDLGRQPLWSRLFETFGEDVFLASVMGVASVEGGQANPSATVDSLLANQLLPMLTPASGVHLRFSGDEFTVVEPSARRREFGDVFVAMSGKHFLGYSIPFTGKDRTTAWIPERQLREYFLPTFKAAIDAGIRTMMVNSGDINGIPVHANKEILTDLLRAELGFRGVVVSDWEDIIKLQNFHRVARTRRDAVRMAIDAGLDMSMVPNNTSFIDDLLGLVHSGDIKESRIDESVRRILKLKIDLGLMQSAGPDSARLTHANAPQFRAVSRRAAEESITLLKNERGLLPLRRGARVLVTGPGATSVAAMHGGWSYTWQGADTAMYPKSIPTFLAAMRAQFGPDQVIYSPGATLEKEADIAAAVAAARGVDAIIVALGEPPSAEKPGDVDDFALPEAQLKLARAMEATGIPVVLTLFEGRPRTIRGVVDSARAIVQAYLPGPFGGVALASILAGEVNPSGKLPYSYPRSAADMVPYDRSASGDAHIFSPEGGYHPEWAFGHGLSYTTFAYDSVRLAKSTVGMRDTMVVSVGVTNTGARAGMEVVQVYSRQLYASITPSTRRLRDFEKVSLAPGERRVVTFRIPVERLGFVGRDNRMGVEPGDFEIHIAGKMAKLVVE